MTKRMAGRIEGYRTSSIGSGRVRSLSSAETAQALPRTTRFRSHDDVDEDEDEMAEVDNETSRS